jgi:uncharacterized protein DUF6650
VARYRLTGISVPWIGIQWERVKQQDRSTGQAVLRFLADRRVLFGDRHVEDQYDCLRSVFEIRVFLTERLVSDDIGDDLAGTIGGMRSACRRFIDVGGRHGRNFVPTKSGGGADERFALALGDLRSQFGFYIEAISSQYRLDVAEELAEIMPPGPDEDDLTWLPGFEGAGDFSLPPHSGE